MFEMIDRELCDALMTYFEKRGVPFGESNARLHVKKGANDVKAEKDAETLKNILAL